MYTGNGKERNLIRRFASTREWQDIPSSVTVCNDPLIVSLWYPWPRNIKEEAKGEYRGASSYYTWSSVHAMSVLSSCSCYSFTDVSYHSRSLHCLRKIWAIFWGCIAGSGFVTRPILRLDRFTGGRWNSLLGDSSNKALSQQRSMDALVYYSRKLSAARYIEWRLRMSLSNNALSADLLG